MSSRAITFKTLWLISQRDVKARKLDLSRQTLLLGRNGTGKSRVTKNLFWVFGCDPPKRNVGNWDHETIAGLDFSFRDKDYFVLRQGPRFGIFLGEELLFAANKRSEWTSFIANFFGYRLKLPRPSTERYDQAGMEYLTLPFYMDQDGSWGTSWDTYENLGQFKQWKKPTFEAFIGLRPNAYFAAKQNRDELSQILNRKRAELDAQTAAFRRVESTLPEDVPVLDPQVFRDELAQLGKQAADAYELQVQSRARLLAVVSTREQLKTELQLAAAAHRELNADIVYLSDMPSGPIECPTCGVQHDNSFHARLNLSQDAEAMSALVSELQSRAEAARAEEADVRAQLSTVTESITSFDVATRQKKADLVLSELLAAESRRTLDVAFNRVSAEITEEIVALETKERELKAHLKLFEDRHRLKTVSESFSVAVSDYSRVLNVPLDEQVAKVVPGHRAQAGGSSAPRSMLAVHLALLKTNLEFGDCPQFPFVVDTPQQSGQDESNLRQMIEVLEKTAGKEHQIILAIETLPDETNVSDYLVVPFEKSHGALLADDYALVAERIRGALKAMTDSLAEAGSVKRGSRPSTRG